MKQKPFYHATTRNLVATFGAIFNDLYIKLDPSSPDYKVPLRFANRDKFLSILTDAPDPYSKVSQRQSVHMAFDLTGMNYASERAKNTNNLITSSEKDERKVMYTRVPYDLSFSLFIASKDLEPSLMILEQILPIFRPALNVTIEEVKDFNLKTDISIGLNSVNPMMEYEGDYREQRIIMWELQFTMKAWYYCRIDTIERIKEVIVDLFRSKGSDNHSGDEWFSEYTASVNPKSARKEDEHEIIEKWEAK